jgi:hypothetical protein
MRTIDGIVPHPSTLGSKEIIGKQLLRAPCLTTTSSDQRKPDHVSKTQIPDTKQDVQAQVDTYIILEM